MKTNQHKQKYLCTGATGAKVRNKGPYGSAQEIHVKKLLRGLGLLRAMFIMFRSRSQSRCWALGGPVMFSKCSCCPAGPYWTDRWPCPPGRPPRWGLLTTRGRFSSPWFLLNRSRSVWIRVCRGTSWSFRLTSCAFLVREEKNNES